MCSETERAVGTRSSRSPRRWNWPARNRWPSWPRERTGSTAPPTPRGRTPTGPPSHAPRPLGSTPARIFPATTPTRSSRRWATGSSPGQRAPTWPTWRSDGRGNLLHQDDVEPSRTVHADRQGELDVGRAARSRDQGQVRGQGARRRGEEVVQRIEDTVPAYDRHVVRREEPRLDRPAALARADDRA